IAASDFSLPAVLALAFADGTIALTARGHSRAAVASVLAPSNTLRSGNAVLNVIFSTTSAAGPAVAGVVVAVTSTAAALAIAAASFALVTVLLAAAAGLPPASLEPAEGWWTRLRDGIAYLRAS